MSVLQIGDKMPVRMRMALPLAQVALAIALTLPTYLRPESVEHPANREFGVNWGFALNAPAMLCRYLVQRLALQFCPEKYMSGSWAGCEPLPVVFETVVYFAFVWFLWRVVLLELSGRGESILTPRTKMRVAADVFAVLFGVFMAFFGTAISRQLDQGAIIVWITYLIWAVMIVLFYGHDLWVCIHRREQTA
jgi:hypothetical protein